jgi:hypothetical protein
MKLIAKNHGNRFDTFTTTNLGTRSEAEAIIMLGSFERELDALLSFMDEERTAAVSESVIRRYLTAEDITTEITDAYKRITIKMDMCGARITSGIGGVSKLEDARESHRSSA